MANIDTTAIEGFEVMTPEQKVEALLKLDIPEKVDLTGYISKAQFDKVTSELADTKKQLKGKMTEDEAKKAEEDKARSELENKYQELLKKSTIAEHTSKYLALGYDEKLARSTAEALFDGDMDKVFQNQQTFNAAYEKKLRADLVKSDPRPGGAGGGNDEKTAGEKIAERIGKNRAEANTAANEILKHFTGGN